MRKTIMRVLGSEWCCMELELSDSGRFSMCGSAGSVLTAKQAREESLESMISFFEGYPEAIRDLNNRCGTRFRSARSAARYVLNTDGEFHGLDIYREDDDKVYITHSCGQIVEELARFFPEHMKYQKWHLNDMRAECEHQEARGENYNTHPYAVCPDCQYRLGSEWKVRELPTELLEWFRTVDSN